MCSWMPIHTRAPLEQRVGETDCQAGGLNLKGKEEHDWRKRDGGWKSIEKNTFPLMSNSFYHHLPFLMHN